MHVLKESTYLRQNFVLPIVVREREQLGSESNPSLCDWRLHSVNNPQQLHSEQ